MRNVLRRLRGRAEHCVWGYEGYDRNSFGDIWIPVHRFNCTPTDGTTFDVDVSSIDLTTLSDFSFASPPTHLYASRRSSHQLTHSASFRSFISCADCWAVLPLNWVAAVTTGCYAMSQPVRIQRLKWKSLDAGCTADEASIRFRSGHARTGQVRSIGGSSDAELARERSVRSVWYCVSI